MTVSLSEAVSAGKLAEFVAQEESRDLPKISKLHFEQFSKLIFKAPQSQNQTSGSHAPDYLSGKKTR